jgi:hypothetical protein
MESVKVVTVKPIEATPSTFKDYGQVIEPSPDHQGFGPHDAQLDLTQGIPRFSFNLNFYQLINVFTFFLKHPFASSLEYEFKIPNT